MFKSVKRKKLCWSKTMVTVEVTLTFSQVESSISLSHKEKQWRDIQRQEIGHGTSGASNVCCPNKTVGELALISNCF